MAPKRSRSDDVPASSSSSSTADSKRPKRAAASAALENMKEQIAAEKAGESVALSFAASSSASTSAAQPASAALQFGTPNGSGTVTASKLKTVPAELLDVQQPGQRRTPELYTAALPTRKPDGTLVFTDAPAFTPNLTPAEVLQAGSFGGYYYRPIASGVTGKVHVDAWCEFPDDWFTGLKPSVHLACPMKDPSTNRYKVDCGQDLRAWEQSGWIDAQDPFGWFQWYCRFYLGRRSPDDARQISRWVGVAGDKGRWKTNLIHKCVLAKAKHDDASVSPVVRQTLQHWAYRLTEVDYSKYAKLVHEGKSTSFIR